MPTHSDSFFYHSFEWVDWGAWKSRIKTSTGPEELLILFNSTDMICTHIIVFLPLPPPTSGKKYKKQGYN